MTWQKFKDFWNSDTWTSFFVKLLIAAIFIKLILFPFMTWATGSTLPLAIVESCSMYHSEDFEGIFQEDGFCFNKTSTKFPCKEEELYKQFNLTLEDTESWAFRNGINKGDIIFVIKPKNLDKIDVGDILIFNAGTKNPIIHRVVQKNPFITKGDNNPGLLEQEKIIQDNQIVGKAVFRIPLLGWVKLIFFEPFRIPAERGLC